MIGRRSKDTSDQPEPPAQRVELVEQSGTIPVLPMTIQAVFTEWIKTQGMWAVLFIMVLSYAKPTLDKFVSTHFELVEQLKQDAKYTLETRKDQAAMLTEIKDLTKSNGVLMQELIREKLRTLREPSNTSTKWLELPKTQIPSLGGKYGIDQISGWRRARS